MAGEDVLVFNQPLDNLEFIQCIHCHSLFEIESLDDRAVSSAGNNLNFISYTAAGCEYLDEYSFDTANVPCEISCPHCKKHFESVAQVSASPVWNCDDMMAGEEAIIVYFEDVEILKVSRSFEKTTSINECFKLDIVFENFQDFVLKFQHAIGSVVVPVSIKLKIIAKTKMSNGFCYLGLEESTGRIFRPIFNTLNQQCCWPTNEQLEFGMKYIFSVIVHPDQEKKLTPFPHRNEDIIVSGFSILETPVTGVNSVYPSFLKLAKSDVNEVFSDIRWRRYVDEETECNSAGIVRSDALIKFNKDKQKNYCHIRCPSGEYAFPITTSFFDHIGEEYKEAVIVLGLSRPYKGDSGKFSPARCYILAVGIYLLNEQIAIPPIQ